MTATSRRLLLAAVLALIVAAALVILFRSPPVALRVMRSAVERTIAADLRQELPDGLHVVLCGAGGPMTDRERSGPCSAVVAGERIFIVDAGTGGARNLGPMQIPVGSIDAVLLTHFHSDHIDGLGELALLRWAQGSRDSPLPVLGPTGVEEVVAGFDRAYRLDATYRTAHHGPEVVPPSGAGMTPRPFETPVGDDGLVVWDRDDVRVTAFRVDHTPAEPAVGYRFDYGGRSLVISGDTKKTTSVERHSDGVDLLIHEALAPQLVAVMEEAAAAAGRENLARIMVDVPDYHTTPLEAAEIARDAAVGHLLFNHVVPPLPLRGLETAFLSGVSTVYSGGVTLGRDGTQVSLPSGSDVIDVVP